MSFLYNTVRLTVSIIELLTKTKKIVLMNISGMVCGELCSFKDFKLAYEKRERGREIWRDRNREREGGSKIMKERERGERE